MQSRWLWILGLLSILAPTALYLYLTVPFPGSQDLDWTGVAYAAKRAMPWLRGLGAISIALAAVILFRRGLPGRWKLAGAVLGLVIAGLGLYAPYFLDAGRVFQPPEELIWGRGLSENLPAETLVLGLTLHGESRAYPLRLLIYHHGFEDEIDGEAVWVTYCGMCRTGRVFRPVVEGRALTFRLLGALFRNSVYEDRETGSWWFQANGRALEGPLEGTQLEEIPSEQMTLGQWLDLHPESLVMQPDPASEEGYHQGTFATFDTWTPEPDGGPGFQEPGGPVWEWVVAVHIPDAVRSWPWTDFVEQRLIQERVGEVPVALFLADDGQSFRGWDRRLDGRALDLRLDPETGEMVDDESGSRFGFDGAARGGTFDGRALQPLRVTQEYRHSIERFSAR